MADRSDRVTHLETFAEAHSAAEVLDELPQGVAVIATDATVLSTNRTWRTAGGGIDHLTSAQDGADLVDHCLAAPRAQAAICDHLADGLRRVLAGRAASFELQYEIAGADGSRWFLAAVASVPGEGAVLTHMETTVHHSVQDVLSDLAFHDPLTGLPNRSLVLDRIRMTLIRAQRTPVVPALMFIDLDGFKVINDRFGHAAGDQVLVEASRRLSTAVRDGDTCGRWGGDEFVLVLDLTVPAALGSLVRRIQGAFRRPVLTGGHQLNLGLSIGAVLARGDERVEHLLRRADEAMYDAKRSGDGVRMLGFNGEPLAG